MKRSNKIIYFDNGCRICRIGAKAIGAAKLNNGNALTPLQEMDETVSCNIDKARYCNEIAVYDTSTNETRYGVKGMLWVLEEKFGKVVRLFSLPIIFHLINFFYHIFSYNRRMIAPVYKKVDGDCEPEFHWGYRLGYIGIVIICVLPIFTYYSLIFLVYPNVIAAFLGLAIIRKEKRMEFLGHMATILIIEKFLCCVFIFLLMLDFIDVFSFFFVGILFLAFYFVLVQKLFEKRMKLIELNYLRYAYLPILVLYYSIVYYVIIHAL